MKCPKCGQEELGWSGVATFKEIVHYDSKGLWMETDGHDLIKEDKIVSCWSCGHRMRLSNIKKYKESHGEVSD